MLLDSNVSIFQTLSVRVSELLSLIDDSKKSTHGHSYFDQVTVSVETLLELLSHEPVRLQLVLLFETNIPKLVKIIM